MSSGLAKWVTRPWYPGEQEVVHMAVTNPHTIHGNLGGCLDDVYLNVGVSFRQGHLFLGVLNRDTKRKPNQTSHFCWTCLGRDWYSPPLFWRLAPATWTAKSPSASGVCGLFGHDARRAERKGLQASCLVHSGFVWVLGPQVDIKIRRGLISSNHFWGGSLLEFVT